MESDGFRKAFETLRDNLVYLSNFKGYDKMTDSELSHHVINGIRGHPTTLINNLTDFFQYVIPSKKAMIMHVYDRDWKTL